MFAAGRERATIGAHGGAHRGVRDRCTDELEQYARVRARFQTRDAGHDTWWVSSSFDAGADLIISHHAHILRGIEVYKGKPIFHGLGNFVTVTQALSTQGVKDPNAWALRRKQLFGFEPDPNTPEYPFTRNPG